MTRLPVIVCAFLLLQTLAARCQDLPALTRQAQQLESAYKESEALAKYEELLHYQPSNVYALCRAADLSCRIGNRAAEKSQKIASFRAGKSYADAAFRLEPNSCEVNIVLAIAIGRMALLQGGKDKVAAAGEIKKYAERAIRLDSTNFKGYHLLGRWHYEVSGLNVFERTLAKWFYGALPEASLRQAIACYEKSISLRPAFMLNYLELAKACRRDGQKSRAIRLLRQMDSLPNLMYDDDQVRAEGKKLLADWQ